MLFDEVLEKCDSEVNNNKEIYQLRYRNEQYFDKLHSTWATSFSRLGMSLRTHRGIKPKEEYKPLQIEPSEKSKEFAARNRQALATYLNDDEDGMLSFVPVVVVNAYRTYIETSDRQKDRSGSALMVAFSQKWHDINRESMKLDPERLHPNVEVADIIAKSRDDTATTSKKGPFLLTWSQQDDPWNVVQGSLGEELHHDLTRINTPIPIDVLKKKLKCLSKRVYATMLDRKASYFKNREEIELYVQTFLASVELQHAKFMSVVAGNSKAIVSNDLEGKFQQLFIQTTFGAYCEAKKLEQEEIRNATINTLVNVKEFIDKKRILKLKNRKYKGKEKSPEVTQSSPENVPATSISVVGEGAPSTEAETSPQLAVAEMVPSVPVTSTDGTTAVPPETSQKKKKQKPFIYFRAPKCSEDFLEAGNNNFKKFQKILEESPTKTRYPSWSPQLFVLRLETDKLVRVAVQFRQMVDDRLLALRQEARRRALGYARIQPLYEEIPEFNKKYAKEGCKIIKSSYIDSVHQEKATKRREEELQQRKRLLGNDYNQLEGEEELTNGVEYELRRWTTGLGYEEVESLMKVTNVGGLPRLGYQCFHPSTISEDDMKNSLNIQNPMLLLNWVFNTYHSCDLKKHAMPSFDAASVAIDFTTDQVYLFVRREGIIVKETLPMIECLTVRKKSKSGLCSQTIEGNGIFVNNPVLNEKQHNVQQSSNNHHHHHNQQDNNKKSEGYIEWKLVNDIQYEELQEEKQHGNVLSWLIRHEDYDSAEIWIQHLNSIDTLDGYGFSPLQLACTKNNVEFVKKVLHLHEQHHKKDEEQQQQQRGPDVNLQNKQGNTALHLAIMNNNLEVAALLLNYHCDITIKNKENKTAFEMFPTLESRSKFFLEQAFTFTALKARSYAFWFYLLEIRDLDEMALGLRVQEFVQTYTALAYAKDPHGRVAVDMATPHNKAVINALFLWHGRYRVVETRPEHQSSTCYVYRALDEQTIDETTGQFKQVALKLVRMKAHFQREIMARKKKFHSDYVVDIIARFPQTDEELENWPEDVSDSVLNASISKGNKKSPDVPLDATIIGVNTKAEAEQFFCLVMPYASRNMFVALKQERFAGRNMEEVRHIFMQLVHCVAHLHERGVLHADLKTLNMVRMETQWKLIDMDASCIIGQETVGYKTSSAYLPPEAIYVDKSKSLVKVRSCAPQYVSESAEKRGYELLMADPSFDVWSLGCILYQMSNTDVRPLFQGGQDDNLSLDPTEDDNLFLLAEWSSTLKTRKLQRVTDPLARNLLSQMLQKDPKRRPTLSRVLAHPFLAATAAKLAKANMGGHGNALVSLHLGADQSSASMNYDVFISYRRSIDYEHAERMYQLLTSRGLTVWWDQICIPKEKHHHYHQNQDIWHELSIDGLMKSKAFIVILSPHAVNHPDKEDHNFSMQHEDSSPPDPLLVQKRLALELRSLKRISKVFPVMIGHKRIESDPISGKDHHVYDNFFACKGNPMVKDIVVKELEVALRYHLDRHALGSPLEDSKTVKAIVSSVLACQGAIIQGKADDAFSTAAETIVTMLTAPDEEEEEEENGNNTVNGTVVTAPVASSLGSANDDHEIQQLKDKLQSVRESVRKLQAQLQDRWDDYLVDNTGSSDGDSNNTANLDSMRALNQSMDQSLSTMREKVEYAKQMLSLKKEENLLLKQRCGL